MKEIFPGVFSEGKSIYTINLIPGKTVYTEKLIQKGKKEYREWVPYKSKLAAAIKNGLKTFPFDKRSMALYLGSATGTTPSHLSDIITEGAIFCIEFSERMMREFMKNLQDRENLIPILADARKPEAYGEVGEVDVIYSDLAQPDMCRIAMENCKRYLKSDGVLMIAIKSQSIDVTMKPESVYRDSEKILKENCFEILETIKLDPYEGDHAMIVARFSR